MNRNKFEVPRTSQPWLVTFADLLMVILILFVLLYSYSDADFDSVTNSFQNHNRSSGPEGGGAGDGEEKSSDEEKDSTDSEKTVPKEYEDQLEEMIKREKHIKEILDYVKTYAIEHDLEDKMTVTPTEKGIEVVLPEIMLFPSGKADLIKEAELFLNDMAPLLAEISNIIEIEGHTDNRPISTERFPSNWDLSTARANVVIRYLTEEHKLDADRFKAVGYGEYQPISSNDTDEGRSKNRRVVLIISNENFPK
ncbi:OmpA family protein [Siminovitchia fortis]|uniref:OmpA family protein n=1 Tax=Siminovitchia fortis TaxID=254758 RepID=UPI0011A7F353|nr:OmpA family protein [Siminovitchia fortis]